MGVGGRRIEREWRRREDNVILRGGEVSRLIKGEKGKGRVWLGDIRVVYDNL